MNTHERPNLEETLDFSAPSGDERGGRKQRRRYLRVTPERGQPIRVHINGVDFLEIMYANSFSEGGLSVKVNHAFSGCDIDLPVSLIVSLPEPVRHDLLLMGKIRHVADDIFGIGFLKMSTEHRYRIRQYMRHRLRHESWRIRWGYRLKNLFRGMR